MPRDDDDDYDDDDDERPVRRRRRASSGGGFVDIFLFKKMVGPWLLIIMYWLLVLLFIGYGIFMMIGGIFAARQFGAFSVILGVVGGGAVMIIGPLFYRIFFEVMITIFRIYETLLDIRDNTKR